MAPAPRLTLARIARHASALRRGAVVAVLAFASSAAAQGPVPLGGEFRVNTTTDGSQSGPEVAMAADRTSVVVWEGWRQIGPGVFDADIYAQRYSAAGVALGDEFRVTTTARYQLSPSVAVDPDGAFVVVWTSDGQDGDRVGVYARRYSGAGVALGGEFRVNTVTANSQRFPSVAMDADGDFVVAWDSDVTGDGDWVVKAQRYSAAGVAQGTEFQVNTYTMDSQVRPFVAMSPDGGFVVAWTSGIYAGAGLPGQDGSGSGVYAQRYSAAGVAQGPEFQVNTYTPSNQYASAVGVAADGSFVVVWESQIQFADPSARPGIFAQRYSAAGVPLGGEFRVNTYTTNGQSSPSMAMDADGDFVVAWESNTQDGSDYGVYAQRYAASGVAVGGEFRVNTTTADSQGGPRVAMAADGAFVVAWEGNGPGDNLGVFAQRYDATPVASDSGPSSALVLAVSPNPAASVAVVRYEAAEAGPVRVSVADVLGHEVAVLWDGVQAAGAHQARLDAGRLAVGLYVVRVTAGRQTATARLVVAR